MTACPFSRRTLHSIIYVDQFGVECERSSGRQQRHVLPVNDEWTEVQEYFCDFQSSGNGPEKSKRFEQIDRTIQKVKKAIHGNFHFAIYHGDPFQ